MDANINDLNPYLHGLYAPTERETTATEES